MNWSASAIDATRSSCLMTVIVSPCEWLSVPQEAIRNDAVAATPRASEDRAHAAEEAAHGVGAHELACFVALLAAEGHVRAHYAAHRPVAARGQERRPLDVRRGARVLAEDAGPGRDAPFLSRPQVAA